ncbi:MAG: preprotein translocase subunit SecG [Phycisphaerales bacterium]|nr:preprotein translocase subunit SecG [Phycisphaerales bacterium]
MFSWFSILIVLFILSSVVLVLVILVQRPQGGGLAQAFGGASGGGSDTAFGGRTGDVLTYITMGSFAFYLLVAIGLNVIDNQNSIGGVATEEQMVEPGLLPVEPAPGGTSLAPEVPAVVPPAPLAPATGVAASDQPLIAPEPAPLPTPEPAPLPTPEPGTPASGNP